MRSLLVLTIFVLQATVCVCQPSASKVIADVKKDFGSEIAKIVDGLTKISSVMDANISQQAENFKKILLTLTDDPRVILIKLADRLHNMRTLKYIKTPEKRRSQPDKSSRAIPVKMETGVFQRK